ncbi:MAG: hypothetical protein CMD82_01095 [Gammaproteobacteria bacterium]|nr:hypothetical protein [Gammaproteobacteria bacterium]|tara:strand:- start:4901 stop:5488 length:588 start_codon:yes stop_codon:yes gene_type:complete
MKFFKHIIVFLALIPSVSLASENSPDDFLKDSVQEVMLFISENKSRLEEDDRYLTQKMNEIVIPKLDIELMSRIVVGKKNWGNISDEEKKNFILAFRNLMVKTYMKSLTAFEGEKIKFLPYVPGKRPDIAKVKSIYLLSEGEIPVSYRLRKTNNNWKVYDIIIDGISLLKNYRSDFKSHINDFGIVSLIDKLNSD